MKVLRIIGSGLLGLIAGYVLIAVLGMLLIPSAPADNGGTAMGIFFGLAPLGGLIGAIFGAVIGARRTQRPPG